MDETYFLTIQTWISLFLYLLLSFSFVFWSPLFLYPMGVMSELTPLSLGNTCLYTFGCIILFLIPGEPFIHSFYFCFCRTHRHSYLFILTQAFSLSLLAPQRVMWVSLIHKIKWIFYIQSGNSFFQIAVFNLLYQTIIYRIWFEFIILLFAFFLGHPFSPFSAFFELILFYF